jgi:hypothetical protein
MMRNKQSSVQEDPNRGTQRPHRFVFRCEHALAAAALLVLGVAVLDAFADRFDLLGRSVVAAVTAPANAAGR